MVGAGDIVEIVPVSASGVSFYEWRVVRMRINHFGITDVCQFSASMLGEGQGLVAGCLLQQDLHLGERGFGCPAAPIIFPPKWSKPQKGFPFFPRVVELRGVWLLLRSSRAGSVSLGTGGSK